MRVALAVNPVGPDPAANLDAILRLTYEAADRGARLVLFPEAALTGLINNDDPAHDLPLGIPIPGKVTDRLTAVARERSLWLGIGLFEREGERLYDSAVLLTPQGEVGLKYRRISPGWHHPGADPAVYGEGTDLPVLPTPFGTVMFVLCGDLFDVTDRVRAAGPDYLLCPMARSFDGPWDQARWDREELPEYAAQAREAGATLLLVNYVSTEESLDWPERCFGGAWVIRPDGSVAHSLPLGRPGLLVADLTERRGPGWPTKRTR